MLLEHSSSACCGLGCGFYSGGQLERGILCRKWAEQECWGLHSLAPCLGQELVPPEPLLGGVPHPAPGPHSTLCPVSASPTPTAIAASSITFPMQSRPGHQFMGSAPLNPLQVSPSAQPAARYPWGTKNTCLMPLALGHGTAPSRGLCPPWPITREGWTLVLSRDCCWGPSCCPQASGESRAAALSWLWCCSGAFSALWCPLGAVWGSGGR